MNAIQALDQMTGTKPHNSFKRLFDMMEWCENEIDQACARHNNPDLKQNAFAYLQPPPIIYDFAGLVEPLYRAYCRELLDRMNHHGYTKTHLNPGTYAEILLALMHLSIKTPITDPATYAYARAYAYVFGQTPADIEEREDWPGQIEETLTDCAKQLTRERSCYS